MSDYDLTTSTSGPFGNGTLPLGAVEIDWGTPVGSGTGNYNTFLAIHHKDSEQGFNLDKNGGFLDAGNGKHTHTLLLSDIGTDADGNYIFRLDVNEPNSTTGNVTLSQLQFYTSSAAPTAADWTGTGLDLNKVYDSGGDTVDLSDHSSGSGGDDYVFKVAPGTFGSDPNAYVTLYAKFSGTDGANGGFEEFRALPASGGGVNPEAAAIGIDKNTVLTSDPTVSVEGLTVLAGTQLTWTYSVTSSPDSPPIPGSDFTVTDDQPGVTPVAVTQADGHNIGDTNDDGNLDTNETWLYTATGTAVDGLYVNVGEAKGVYDAGGPNEAPLDALDVSGYNGAATGIKIDKVTIANGHTIDSTASNVLAGTALTWQYTVTNTGDVALSGVGVIDDKLGAATYVSGDTNTDGKLDTNETWIFSASGTAAAGPYHNTGTASGSFTDDVGGASTPSAQDDSGYNGVSTGIKIDKVTIANGHTIDSTASTVLAGTALTWQYAVTNTGSVALSGVGVTDDKSGTATYVSGDTNTDGKLDTNETWIFTTSGVAGTGPYNNTGTASGSFTDDVGQTSTPTAHDDSGYTGVTTGIKIDKVTIANGHTIDSTASNVLTGTALTWQYTVTNTGAVALSGVGVTDDQSGAATYVSGDTNTDGKLDTNETWIFTTTGAAAAGPYHNTGTASGSYTDGVGQTSTPTAHDDSGYNGVSTGIKIDKVTIANGHTIDSTASTVLAGTALTWQYTVTNTGTVALSGVGVTDNQGVTPVLQSGDLNNNHLLDTNETWIYTASGVAGAGAYHNVGTTGGTYTDDVGQTSSPTAHDDSGYFGATTGIHIDKTTTGKDTAGVTHTGDGISVVAGSAVTWTYTVTNTGNEALSNVSVADNKGVTPVLQAVDLVHHTGDLNGNHLLDTNETWIYTASGTAGVGAYGNVGTASGSYTDNVGQTSTPSSTDPSSYTGVFVQSHLGLTIGYWYNHQSAWTLATNLAGPANKDGSHTGILLGDANGNLTTDAGENTLFISKDMAAQLINSSQTANDTRQILLSQAIAAQLNIDTHSGDPGYHTPVTSPVTDLISEAVQWLKGTTAVYSDGSSGKIDTNGNGILDAAEYSVSQAKFSTAALTSSTKAWQQPVAYATHDYGTVHADGEGLKNALQALNQNQLVVDGSGLFVAWDDSGSATGPYTDVLTNGPNDFWKVLLDHNSLSSLHGVTA